MGLSIPGYADAAALFKPSNNLGLVGYWSLNEGAGTIATDFSGNRNHGTLQNFSDPFTPTSGWVNGKRGTALAFAGTASDDSVNVGDINALEGQSAITVSAWIYDRNPTQGRGIISKYAGATPALAFFTSDSGAGGADDLSFSPDGNESTYTTGNVHQANRWEHWVAVFNAGTITLYLNSVAQTTTDTGTIPGTTNSTTNVIRIGADSDLGAEFEGIVDEVRLYNRTLTGSEITALYNSGAVRAFTSTKNLQTGSTLRNGLVGHWTFDGADFTNFVADVSGNGNHGFLFNTATSTMRINGVLGQAIQLDDTDDYVAMNDAASLDITSELSTTAWVKLNATTGAYDIHGKYDGGIATNYSMQVATGELCFYFSVSGDHALCTNGANLQAGVWYHLGITYNDAANNIALYVNGVPQSEQIAVGTPEAQTLQTNSGAFEIGEVYDGEATNGMVDDVRLYNRTLSATEIKQLYNLGRAVITP